MSVGVGYSLWLRSFRSTGRIRVVAKSPVERLRAELSGD
jgi:hypothetical protein